MKKINFKKQAIKKSKKVINKKQLTDSKKDQQNNYKYPMETRHRFLSKLQMMNKMAKQMVKSITYSLTKAGTIVW